MNISRWPDLLRLDPFDDTLRTLMRPLSLDTENASPQMRLDVREIDGRYAVKAEIPGARKEDIDVRLDGRQVTLSAEIRRDSPEGPTLTDGPRNLRSERYYGYVCRTFTLAEEVDEEKAQARYENGVLELELPKKATAASHRLPVA